MTPEPFADVPGELGTILAQACPGDVLGAYVVRRRDEEGRVVGRAVAVAPSRLIGVETLFQGMVRLVRIHTLRIACVQALEREIGAYTGENGLILRLRTGRLLLAEPLPPWEEARIELPVDAQEDYVGADAFSHASAFLEAVQAELGRARDP
jgi:hypothetical protein